MLVQRVAQGLTGESDRLAPLSWLTGCWKIQHGESVARQSWCNWGPDTDGRWQPQSSRALLAQLASPQRARGAGWGGGGGPQRRGLVLIKARILLPPSLWSLGLPGVRELSTVLTCRVAVGPAEWKQAASTCPTCGAECDNSTRVCQAV